MASTRISLSSNPLLRREPYTHYCPTCGVARQRDGARGAFNRALFCDQACHSKWFSMAIPAEYNRSNVTSVGADLAAPPRTGDSA